MPRRPKAQITFHSLPGIPGFEAVRARNMANAFPRHVHGVYVLVLVEDGSRLLRRGDATFTIPEGWMYVLNPHEAHACAPASEAGCGYLALCMDGEALRDIAACTEMPSAPFFRSEPFADALLATRMRQLFAKLESAPNAAHATDAAHALHGLVTALLARHATQPPAQDRQPHRAITPIKDFLETHFAATPTLVTIAQAACLSPCHCQRIFTRETGLSPHDWLVRIRIRKARALLDAGCPPTQAALDAGFADLSHLTRTFRTAMGTTPGHYAANRH
ncbi:AraC-like DNA-binding protein [Desulfobaculum xiamenense]|uniref:AraC-like DNA-binding protein n=1 Tax=Desulfobaculum xiamenense TaxID=995050 RepID=A0A846QHP3_9BACT|nr:AraC family transcriptional regulator [Desulfobaculum xiamenense]NJB66547.1 AraC-like DNA-binding protein [Desulfobaculum xiamenense]